MSKSVDRYISKEMEIRRKESFLNFIISTEKYAQINGSVA